MGSRPQAPAAGDPGALDRVPGHPAPEEQIHPLHLGLRALGRVPGGTCLVFHDTLFRLAERQILLASHELHCIGAIPASCRPLSSAAMETLCPAWMC